MVALMLVLMAGGIAFSQAVSDPRQVTGRWLRLGGIIALCLLAVAATVAHLTHAQSPDHFWLAYAAVLALVVGQLLTVQRGWFQAQRALAALAFVATWALGIVALPLILAGDPAHQPGTPTLTFALGPAIGVGLSAALMGGFLMTMLLGHAYLTAGGEMTQAPLRRLVLAMAVVLALRIAVSAGFGLWPFLHTELPRATRMWTTVMMTARWLVGLAMPCVFTYMIHDCVQRRSNQSATGILYVAGVMILIGEGVAMGLGAWF
jgi:hypothetical protein